MPGAIEIYMAAPVSIPEYLRRLLAFGSGVGIQIGETDLEVVAARVRPSRIQVLGRLTSANYHARPAAEWGAGTRGWCGEQGWVT